VRRGLSLAGGSSQIEWPSAKGNHCGTQQPQGKREHGGRAPTPVCISISITRRCCLADPRGVGFASIARHRSQEIRFLQAMRTHVSFGNLARRLFTETCTSHWNEKWNSDAHFSRQSPGFRRSPSLWVIFEQALATLRPRYGVDGRPDNAIPPAALGAVERSIRRLHQRLERCVVRPPHRGAPDAHGHGRQVPAAAAKM